MAELTLFPSYHNPENQATNYCGLILKLVYQASPLRLEEILGSLIGDRIPVQIGPRFEQQRKYKNAIPDLEIRQSAFTIRMETKLGTGHDVNQLANHIDALKDPNGLKIVLLLNSSEEETYLFEPALQAGADRAGVVLVHLSFDNFYSTLDRKCRGISETLDDEIEQFGDYLADMGLRSSWQGWINVLSTQHSQNEIAGNVYMCPLTRAYSFSRTKYLGTYWDKHIRTVHSIRACVIIDLNQTGARVKWKNSKDDDSVLQSVAISAVKSFPYRAQENVNSELQVYLLDPEFANTKVLYDSYGGMRGHRYLPIPMEFAVNVSEAAKFLKDQETFSNVKSIGAE